ncbi:hypothetical protein KAT24_02495 [Candidatus Pacearchaeota archaeon]|nr:hypothetical protein [Candidatus Pacearchaeota archaeon]
MGKQNINYEIFVKLWKKANEDQKAKMFYYSLFDFKSFEEEARIEILNKIKEIQNKLNNLIRRIDKRFFRKVKKEKFVKYAGNDRLLKYILIYELRRRGIKVKSCGNNFPDLMIDDRIHLEMKRQVTTKNMGDDFWGVDLKECDQLIFLIMFPLLEEDNKERVKDLTNGYYFIKKALSKKRKTDLLICYPDMDNFEKILERIINCIKSPNWYKNE